MRRRPVAVTRWICLLSFRLRVIGDPGSAMAYAPHLDTAWALREPSGRSRSPSNPTICPAARCVVNCGRLTSTNVIIEPPRHVIPPTLNAFSSAFSACRRPRRKSPEQDEPGEE